MHIEPLTYETLDEAIKLVNQVFPYQQTLFDKASFAFPFSLKKKSIITKIVSSIVGFTEVRYWLAIDEVSRKIIGTTGLYDYKQDKNEAWWLAWTCVDAEFRGQGIGGKLVDFAIEKARAEGKNFIRLYTWNYPDQAAALTLYKKRGFRISGEEKIRRTEFKKIYMELEL